MLNKNIVYQFYTFTTEHITPEYIDYLNDPIVNRFLEVRHVKQTKQTVTKYIESFYQTEEKYIWGIYDGSIFVGTTTLRNIDKKHKSAEIGLMIGNANYWGKLASDQAIAMLRDFAFLTLKLESITGGCYDNNLGIVFTFKKLGFMREHTRNMGDNPAHQWRLTRNQNNA